MTSCAALAQNLGAPRRVQLGGDSSHINMAYLGCLLAPPMTASTVKIVVSVAASSLPAHSRGCRAALGVNLISRCLSQYILLRRGMASWRTARITHASASSTGAHAPGVAKALHARRGASSLPRRNRCIAARRVEGINNGCAPRAGGMRRLGMASAARCTASARSRPAWWLSRIPLGEGCTHARASRSRIAPRISRGITHLCAAPPLTLPRQACSGNSTRSHITGYTQHLGTAARRDALAHKGAALHCCGAMPDCR